MKRIIISFIIPLFFTAGCTVNDLVPEKKHSLRSITATTSEVIKSRAHLENKNIAVWDPSDQISIFSNTQPTPIVYSYIGPKNEGTEFANQTEEITGDTFYAFYPYCDGETEVNGSTISYTLEASDIYYQKYAEVPTLHTFPMVAKSNTNQFRFLQTCGVIKLKVKGSLELQNIQLEGNNGEILAGKGTIDIASDAPTFSISSNSEDIKKTHTKKFSFPVPLSKETVTTFCFLVPVQTFSKGLKFVMEGYYPESNGGQRHIKLTKETQLPVDVTRATIKTFTAIDTDDLLKEEKETERDILIALYDAMGGDNWNCRDNWCTDADISQWYGVHSIGANINSLDLVNNNLSGYIPSEIGRLKHLERLNLNNNNLSGSIPESIGELAELQDIRFARNQLSGDVPAKVTELACWSISGWNCISGNQLNEASFNLYLPDFTLDDMNGNPVNSTSIVHNNKYTMLYLWTTFTGDPSRSRLVNLYKNYKNKKLDIIGICTDGGTEKELATTKIEQAHMNWHNILLDLENMGTYDYPSLLFFDSEGKLVCHSGARTFNEIVDFLWENIGPAEYYETTDYSEDGKVHILQKATKGNGIDIIFMGDAFTDRLIADKTYDAKMKEAAEYFFSEEPYTSFRDYFNVYYVTVISKNEEYEKETETALGCWSFLGPHPQGNYRKCMEYAEKIPSIAEKMDDVVITTILNNDPGCGVCSMSKPIHKGDHGGGLSIAYLSASDSESLCRVILHEAGGHGFAKLLDEYEIGSFPILDFVVEENNAACRDYGWGKNVDYTSNPTKVRWSKFLTDPRYANEGLGVFEGAATYFKGAYRSTENSIMRYSRGGYNAPSREAIYYRIHKLAFGTDWVYNFEDFVEWDTKNRNKRTRAIHNDSEQKPITTSPPVIMEETWKNRKTTKE